MRYHVQYCNKRGDQKSFEYDFGPALSQEQVDSLILQATIENEFPNQIALRRIADLPSNASAEKSTIGQIMALFFLNDIEYEARQAPQQIRQKHMFCW